MPSITELLSKFSITPKNKEIYNEAFIHNSYSNEKRLSKNYQRLEFLGDAILQQKVSEFLYHNYKKLDEGILTKYRSSIVRGETLAKFSKLIGLGKYIRLGHGEWEAKGYEKDSILADVFESLTAAIYLDLGNNALDLWLNKTLFDKMNVDIFVETMNDYKSKLQELTQIEMRSDLKYITVSQKKAHNNKILFTVNCIFDDMVYGVGYGFNKKSAEQEAAKNALSKIKKFKKI